MATPGDAWDNYLAQRFGDGLTDECLNTFIKNRETNRAAALAKSTGSDIQAGGPGGRDTTSILPGPHRRIRSNRIVVACRRCWALLGLTFAVPSTR